MNVTSYFNLDADGLLWWTSEHFDLYFNSTWKIWVGQVDDIGIEMLG